MAVSQQVWWHICFPVINGKDKTASKNPRYLYGNLHFYVSLLSAIPKLHQREHWDVSLKGLWRHKYCDKKKPLTKPLMMNSKITVSGNNVSSFNGYGRQKWFRDINHNLKWNRTCLFVCFPCWSNLKKLFFSSPSRKTHVLIEKLSYLMLQIYESDK